ncbi:transcriptional regulator, partial [Pseudomonas aeruginosa]
MQAQDAMEGVLAKVTMNDIVNQVLQHNE